MIPQGMPQSPQMPAPGMFASMARPPMPPQGGPQGGAPMPPQSGAQSLPPQIQQLLQMAAQQGRGGDTLLAHLTPGEIAVPPQVQTPKVLATLKKDFKDKGVNPAQFTAGSPQSSKNPATGLPEYNFMSAFLPAALGLAGAVVAPELLPMLGATGLSTGLMGAIGSGLGTTAGGLAAGQKPTQAALSGLGAGAGGYMLGNIGNGLTAAGNPTEATLMQQAGVAPGAASQTASSAADMAGGLPSAAANHGMSIMGHQINPLGMAGSALGGYLGNQLGAPPKSNQPNLPPGFNTPMTPLNQLPSAQTQLGMNNSKQPMPSFNGFNPATNYPGAYNFYPNSGV